MYIDFIQIILFHWEKSWGGGGRRVALSEEATRPGGAQKCFIRGGSGLALLFTISNREGTPFLIPLLTKSTTFTYLVLYNFAFLLTGVNAFSLAKMH